LRCSSASGVVDREVREVSGPLQPARSTTCSRRKRKALEIIVEERAAARDPEHADGDLPALEDPSQR